MRRLNITVFDEFLTNATGYPAATIFTSQELNSRLGQFDQLGIFAVVDQVTVATTISVLIEHSADGRNWMPKNGTVAIPTPEINAVAISTTAATPIWGSDGGALPTLGFVRLRIWFAVNTTAHVRIHVTARDMGG